MSIQPLQQTGPAFTAFRAMKSLRPAPLLNFIVRYHVGSEVSEVVQVSVR
jgi:hypothetical protein